jgi:hypothetical protein
MHEENEEACPHEIDYPLQEKKKSLPKKKRNKSKFTQISIPNVVLFGFTDF